MTTIVITDITIIMFIITIIMIIITIIITVRIVCVITIWSGFSAIYTTIYTI